MVLDHTPFYAESGGQVGDTGSLVGAAARFSVRDTQKIGASFAHIGVLETGELHVGDEVRGAGRCRAPHGHRPQSLRDPSAACGAAGGAWKACPAKGLAGRAGSIAIRFLAYGQALTAEELHRIEELVNTAIRRNEPAETRVMALDEAVAAGAMSLFGEKYESDVRVLSIGDFSMELCGGTHVERAGDIGLFKIISESGVAAGVRRIEAVTGQAAYEWVVRTDQVLRDIAGLLRGSREDVDEKVRELVERSRRLEKEVQQLKSKLASGQGGDLSAQAKAVGGIKVLAAQIEGADAKALRDAVDQLKHKLGSCGDRAGDRSGWQSGAGCGRFSGFGGRD